MGTLAELQRDLKAGVLVAGGLEQYVCMAKAVRVEKRWWGDARKQQWREVVMLRRGECKKRGQLGG